MRSIIPFILCSLSLFQGTHAGNQGDSSNPARIVTIGGAATEIVFALGAGEQVVAVDLSSTYPPVVEALPKVGYVRAIAPEGVLSMEPDLIVATGALGPDGARQSIKQFPIDAILLPELQSLPELTDSIERVARHLDAGQKGRTLITMIQEQVKLARAKARAWEDRRPSVLFILQAQGPSASGMAGGQSTRAHSMIEMAGGRNAAASFAGFQPFSDESLLSFNPDIILVGQSEGHAASAEALETMLEDPALSAINAVQGGAVHAVPLDDLAFGPRLGEAVLRWNQLIAQSLAKN